MSETLYIHIHNWDRFQHRDTTRNKTSAAPWIKDSPAQLNDEDYLPLTFAQRGLLQDLRRQYALNRGRGIRADAASVTRLLGQRVFTAQLERLNHAGFIEFSASKLPASCQQPASLDVDVDKEQPPIPQKEEVPELRLAEEPKKNGRKRDLLFEAMIEAFEPGKLTKSSRGALNRAVGELREVGAEPGQVSERKASFEQRYPDIRCTPNALAKHWPYLEAIVNRGAAAELEHSRQLAAHLMRGQ